MPMATILEEQALVMSPEAATVMIGGIITATMRPRGLQEPDRRAS